MDIGNPDKTNLDVKRITAIWGFSEAAFGGILHALKIPLTGLFIGSAAIIFITLIASASKEKSTILKSTIIVILVKAVVSPHSPLAAYFAVLMQGSLGYLFFTIIKNEKISATLLGFFTMLFSSLQKLIVLTLLFGNTIWDSIDLFVDFILNQVGLKSGFPIISFSYIIILLYISIHLIAGFFVGIYATNLKDLLKKEYGNIDSELILTVYTENYFSTKSVKKKRFWLLRPTGIVILILSISVMVISYISPKLDHNVFYEIIFMIIRSIAITIIWYSIVSPFLLKRFVKVIEKKKFKYAGEINEITGLFPNFLKIINYSWKESSIYKGSNRVKKFFIRSLALLLTIELKNGSIRNHIRTD